MMPGMSGAEFYDEVERRWPALLGRILVVTGGAVTPRSKALLARIVNPPLEKPFTTADIEARIAAIAAIAASSANTASTASPASTASTASTANPA
jgi:DNA-binding NarL/FixJ family response regulator